MTEGYLWTGQYPETKRILEKGNNQSMELHEPTLKGFWSEDDNNGTSFFIINEAIISKLCILGEDVEPCFEGAQITRVQFSFEPQFQEKIMEMMAQVKEINEKGGTDSVDKDKTQEMEEEVLEDKTQEEEAPAEPEVDETSEEEVEEETIDEEVDETPEEEAEEALVEPEENSEGEAVKYNLDEIQEYIELKSNYEELENKFNEMKAEYEELVAFKLAADRKEKQAMIDGFYMLTEEDKKDVIENIDKYSLDDIEAKLSVICVRNRVSFDLNEEEEKPAPTVFNLEDTVSDDNIPAWVKAAMAMKKEME